MRDILLICITIFCSVTALRSPVIGILAYISYSLLAPHSLALSFSRTFPHVELIAICTIIGYLFWSEPKTIPRQRETTLLLILWAMFGFSTLAAFRPEHAVEDLIHISKIFLMVGIATSLINNEQRLQLLAKVMALSLGFYGLKIGLFVVRTGGHSLVSGPDASFLSANNSLGMALAMNVPILLYLSRQETNRWLRWLMKAMMAFSYPAVAGTFSRGSWLALATATALLVLKSRHRLTAIAFTSLVVVTTPLWLPNVVSTQMVNRYDSLINYKEDGSAQSRFWNWEFCARVGYARPLTGGGFSLYSKEAYETFFPAFLERYPSKIWSCHSTWLSMFAEHGIFGLGLWLALMGFCFASLRQLRWVGTIRQDLQWMTAYSDMVQIALASFVVSSSFVDFGYFEMYYFLVVVVAQMKEIAQHRLTQAVPVVSSPSRYPWFQPEMKPPSRPDGTIKPVAD